MTARVIIALTAVLACLFGSAAAAAPSGGKIAFESSVGGNQQVFTINPDGSDLTQVTHLAGSGLLGLTWRNPQSLVFSAATGTGPDTLYSVDAGGGPVTAVSRGCTHKCLGDDFPRYTRNGKKVAFERAFGPIVDDNAAVDGIFTMNADGTGLRQITQRHVPTTSEDHHPSWSPNGSRIVFQRLNTKAMPLGATALFVVNADGTHLKRLTSWRLNANNPVWSPDGKRIAFSTYDPPVSGKHTNVFTIRPNGKGLHQLTHYTGSLQAYVDDWSPNARQIVFHLTRGEGAERGPNDLYVINADGSAVHRLTHMPHGSNPSNAVWTSTP
jgi:TolB protein